MYICNKRSASYFSSLVHNIKRDIELDISFGLLPGEDNGDIYQNNRFSQLGLVTLSDLYHLQFIDVYTPIDLALNMYFKLRTRS